MRWLEVLEGDITKIKADAIVNAANTGLAMGGGVCGAIFRSAGIGELSEACHAIGHCPTGSAVITPAFGIKTAKFIIHAVGPVYSRHPASEARELLRSAYRTAIRLAKRNSCKSIAFPAISTGIYGYPLHKACKEAVAVCAEEAAADHIHVKLVAFDAVTAACLRQHSREAEG
jgi:O-acetyl-ADP-ribose deacetylase (regulator of RNase III)